MPHMLDAQIAINLLFKQASEEGATEKHSRRVAAVQKRYHSGHRRVPPPLRE